MISGKAETRCTPFLAGCQRFCGVTVFVVSLLVSGLSFSTVWHGWMRPLGLWPHGRFELVLFCFEVLMLIWCYYSAVIRGPSFVPLGWAPTADEFAARQEPPRSRPFDQIPEMHDCLQYCKECKGFKPPRAHHCSTCGRCVLWMDHHCPWTNTCVGHRNFKPFVLFVHYVPIACLHCLIVHSEWGAMLILVFMKRPMPQFWAAFLQLETVVIAAVWTVALALVLVIGSLAWEMHYTMGGNITMIEDMIVEKARSRRRATGERRFVYPYDLGGRENRRQVMGRGLWRIFPLGTSSADPFWPPLREGCCSFELSCEQLAQKAYKLSRSWVLHIKQDFQGAGRWGFRFWCMICCRFGCATALTCDACCDRMLTVKQGDKVLVSSVEQRWLQGRPMDHSEAPSGWFPRQCVSEDNVQKYQVPFQKALQGAWQAAAGRLVHVTGMIVRVQESRVPYVLLSKDGATLLLGCKLIDCDGTTATWSNGDAWTRIGPQMLAPEEDQDDEDQFSSEDELLGSAKANDKKDA